MEVQKGVSMEFPSVRNMDDVVKLVKIFISSFLSYGVVVGASILKLPQIIAIVRSGSAKGISLTSNLVELLAYVISLSWGINQKLNFRDFGENVIIFLQLLGLVSLVAHYQKNMGKALGVVSIEFVLFYLLLQGAVPVSVHKSLLSGQILLNICSRVPQIVMNFCAKSTGQLSFLTFFLALGGGVARVMTTALNVPWAKGKGILLTQYSVAALLNMIIIGQILIYKQKKVKTE